MNKSEAIEVIKLLNKLKDLADVEKMLSTFIKAFINNSVKKEDGVYYLHGSFNLGGTVSGRLSSSEPNLQNIPAGSRFAKAIKKCFKAGNFRIMGGADFASLEDRISALTTKDPNKLKVYIDGYDGHCLRAYSYFKDKMPDIVDTVASINSIESLYPKLRQDSKAPTFLLTYGGTYMGLMMNVGLPEADAKAIEANYHELYVVSDEWVRDKIEQASRDGYVTVAFGLRVRTPMLAKTILHATSSIPYEAQAEARTAGNALGQSYGLLNNRAAIEFYEKLIVSPYRTQIRMTALIHDAIYLDMNASLGAIEWANKTIVEAMHWTGLPEIQHPIVKLGGDLDLFFDWSNKLTLPNNASIQEINALTLKHLSSLAPQGV